ncbi:uncharacterized protein LOC128955780 [Oppia nitens]|uniref:uncharacterized protein LOC128955780 n=1 Tax=Oppia nitens TaxID=1686743 RepID=UPI0023DA7EBE|nr:uncharacterized protein LOC128955780 [Oppia nitens]
MFYNYFNNYYTFQHIFSLLLIIIYICKHVYSDVPFDGPTTQQGKYIEDRHNKWLALTPEQRKDPEILAKLCGPYNRSIECTSVIAPAVSEQINCDTICCNQGFLTGFCTSALEEHVVILRPLSPDWHYAGHTHPIRLSAICECTDSWADASCGTDGSFMGIRCPDRSACKRHCCRNKFNTSDCIGVHRLHCDCSNK